MPPCDIMNPASDNPNPSFSSESQQENLKQCKTLKGNKEQSTTRGSIRSEPKSTYMVYGYKEVKTIFQQAGWLDYFDKMKKGDVVIAMEFALTYENVVAEV